MSNFPFGELPLGLPYLSESLTGLLLHLMPESWPPQYYWKFHQEHFDAGLSGYCSPIGYSIYKWSALGQWITKRQMRFEKDIFPFGCLMSGYIHSRYAEFWLGFRPNGSLSLSLGSGYHSHLFLWLLTAQLKTRWRFYHFYQRKKI